jgi:hypothetical protein
MKIWRGNFLKRNREFLLNKRKIIGLTEVEDVEVEVLLKIEYVFKGLYAVQIHSLQG